MTPFLAQGRDYMYMYITRAIIKVASNPVGLHRLGTRKVVSHGVRLASLLDCILQPGDKIWACLRVAIFGFGRSLYENP